MSALNNFAIAANLLQVLSFADTVFRAGKALYELFDKARSASQNIVLLLLDLQSLLSVVAHVRVFIAEHGSSPFAQENGHTVPNLRPILTLIDRDFRHMRGLLAETIGAGTGGWFSFIPSHFRWALKEQEIEDARQRLVKYTQNLNAELSVSGRRNDIVLCTKIQKIEDRLQVLSQDYLIRPPDTGATTQPLNNKSAIRVPRKQTKAIYTPIQPRKSPSSHMKADRTLPRPDRVEEDTNAQVSRQDPAFLGPTIRIYENADQTYLFDTNDIDLDRIIKPAVLLRDYLISSVSAMRTDHAAPITKVQGEHFRTLFDLLLVSAHTASTEIIMKNYSNNPIGIKHDDHKFVSSKKKAMKSQQRDEFYSRTAGRCSPTSVEEQSIILDTNIGSIRAKILSARAQTDSATLGFVFEYLGKAKLDLSPFTVHYKSQIAGKPLSISQQPSTPEELIVPEYFPALAKHFHELIPKDTPLLHPFLKYHPRRFVVNPLSRHDLTTHTWDSKEDKFTHTTQIVLPGVEQAFFLFTQLHDKKPKSRVTEMKELDIKYICGEFTRILAKRHRTERLKILCRRLNASQCGIYIAYAQGWLLSCVTSKAALEVRDKLWQTKFIKTDCLMDVIYIR